MRQMSGSGSSLIAFDLAGGREQAFACSIGSASWTYRITLAIRRASSPIPPRTTHQRLPAAERARLGITEGMLRLSVGLEDPQDIIDDLAQALRAAEAVGQPSG
jgi:O-succinylhomoserine sulfhydrylase